MSETIIRVENLSKCYTLRHQQSGQQYKALRDVMTDGAKLIGHKLFRHKSRLNTNQELFWALKDVDFEIQQGDRVGIIGRNGAGKSTLLKILSRIVEPTTGQIGIKGRVASLLEVGTGFHPELTGRENIYLNGAILGMSRAEITRKFDEIVAFAEVEKFLDTPVKRYSSGMYVRLAFAVAAHLEPEILIVDEVLAVGDAQFQKKCLGKMEDVGKEGQTVLFVSHNMSAINNLCSKAILLKSGQVKSYGAAAKLTEEYYLDCINQNTRRVVTHKDIYIEACSLIDQFNQVSASAYTDEPFCLEVLVQNHQQDCEISLGISVEDIQGVRIFAGLSSHDQQFFSLRRGCNKLRYALPNLPLNEGIYQITLAIHKYPSDIILDRVDQFTSFEVVNRGKLTQGRIVGQSNGLIIVHPQWSQENYYASSAIH
jgi:lipopolysaccharide transport system ATP-binding protein